MADAVVVGSGPNGLTAAAELAREGLEVHVIEAEDTVGGGTRTEELTLPGVRHDVCSAVHPLGAGSPAFNSLPLGDYGLEWVQPAVPMAHPFSDGSAAVLSRSAEETAASLGVDARRWHQLVDPFLGEWDDLAPDVLGPVLRWPSHPGLLAAFAVRAVPSVRMLRSLFEGEAGRGLLAGMGAHVIAPLSSPFTAGAALLFALAAHHNGWPIARGGSAAITTALAGYVEANGGRIETGRHVTDIRELPPARAYLFDTVPQHLVAIAGDRLPATYRRRLLRYRHGPAVFKVDYALDGPVPWRNEACRRAGAVHVGGTFDDVAEAVSAVHRGLVAVRPFLITAQPTLSDPTRAPDGTHVFWAYAHVPNGWAGDLTDAIERQLERFAPGFRDRVLARAVTGPREIEARNPNDVGGDIAGGAVKGMQVVLRPIISTVPYATPNPAIYLCSSSTPPGAGVHGMCGHHAARAALTRAFGRARE